MKERKEERKRDRESNLRSRSLFGKISGERFLRLGLVGRSLVFGVG